MHTLERSYFLNLAAVFEGGLLLIALFLGWLMGINPIEHLYADFAGLIDGILATIPLLVLFAISFRYPVGSMRRIKQLLIDVLGSPLAACRWYDLLLLGVLAGVTEEVLFRGFLQIWFERGGVWIGIIAANIIFGLAHFITPTYAILAGVLGLYMSWIFSWHEPRNLLIPITTHALYDFVAFAVVAHTYRERMLGLEKAKNAAGTDADSDAATIIEMPDSDGGSRPEGENSHSKPDQHPPHEE